jgi:hypothetical protein
MRSKKQIDVTNPLLNSLSTEAKALYFTLLLSSDDGGMVPFDHHCNAEDLHDLIIQRLITVTRSHIILMGYITANYGKELKPEYNPHKSILQSIENTGYQYNSPTNEVDIPTNAQITDLGSLIKLCLTASGTNTHVIKKTTPQVTKSSQSPIIQFVGSVNFALYLSMGLMIGQSVHSSFTLYSISHIPNPYNTVSAIFTALLLDFMMLYFVINGKVAQSMVFFIFCSLMNIYSFHINTQYFTYQSFFAIVVSIAIPYAVHSVSGMVNQRFFHDQNACV